jgi:hypothetical protein
MYTNILGEFLLALKMMIKISSDFYPYLKKAAHYSVSNIKPTYTEIKIAKWCDLTPLLRRPILPSVAQHHKKRE